MNAHGTENVIEVRGFTKRYGSFTAVDGISFDVKRGEVFALLGPNGAGKTSTLESLEGLRKQDVGTLRILGLDPTCRQRKLRAVVGVQLQTGAFPGAMTVREAVKFFGLYHGITPDLSMVKRLGLEGKLDAQYAGLSVGQQRRLTLALAVIHKPAVVFLDEPTAGLDVESRNELHRVIRELRDAGTTVVLATHDMAETESLADRALILLRGRIAAMGTPRQLTSAGECRTKISIATGKDSFLDERPLFPAAELHGTREDYVIYYSDDPAKTIPGMFAWLGMKNDVLTDLRVERPTLEERFLEITGVTTKSHDAEACA